MIKLTDLLNENLRSGDVSKLQKGLERILGTKVHYDINSNDAYEFYIDNAEFNIGVGDGEELGTKFAFDIYNDGATKTLASGTSDNLNDIIKQVLAAARKHKKSLLLKNESVNEYDQWRNTRIQSKHIFRMLKQKYNNNIPKMEKGLETILKQNKTKNDQAEVVRQEFKKYFKIKESVNEEFTAVSSKSGKTVVFKDKDSRDAAVKAGTHSKEDGKDGGDEPKGEKKPNMFSKDAGYDAPDTDKSEPKKGNLPLDDSGDGFTGKAASHIEDELSKSIGIDGTADINANGTIEFAFGDNDRETSLFIGREGGTYNVSVENPYGDDFGDIESFDNESDAIEHAKKLAKEYSKELGAKSEKKTSEPKQNEPVKDSSGGRAGNPQVNKATRQKAKELGITPENLGREEYELKMVQAAHEALTDSNFHSEARKLIAIMEDNPELAKNPSLDPNKPGLGEPGYDDWVKTTAWGSKYGDSSDETDELGRAASNEAGWDGKDALDGIAFELKMRGYKDLARKIQSVFDDEKNEGTIKLTDLI